MENMKLAACGIPCSECAMYKVTMTQDLEAAESLVGWFRSQGWIRENEGAEAIRKKNPLCFGCWDITDDCFWKCGCGSVDFRVCCKERQINHCGECGDFPCEHYKKWTEMHGGHKRAIEHLMSLRENI